MPTALVTGVNGQDGSYLAELLLLKGYRVVGTILDANSDLERIAHVQDKIEVVETDLLNQEQVDGILRKFRPDEIYNLAARASSRELWTQPVLTGQLNALAVARILEGIYKIDPKIRFAQASSSEVFGDVVESPQTEETPFHPRNPYGVAKAYAHWMTAVYREQQGLFACSSIFYNHESPRRGLEFVTRKISHAVAQIKLGRSSELRLGSLDACRDWGFAGDYVRALWLMLQQPNPGDYLIGTGESHTVRDFCEVAFGNVDLDYRDFVIVDAAKSRPPETGLLVGNSSKARRMLGWTPSISFEDLVRMMVDADMKTIRVSRQC